jgi:HSP20 family protein
MTEKQEVTKSKGTDVQGRSPESEFMMRPQVDIFEDANGITLHADMPGVSRDGLDIQVDKDRLLIEGAAGIEMPEGMKALYADVRSTRYRRSFSLSHELDTDKIEAGLKDGVLSVRIPKRAEVRPRKIDVQQG